MQRFFGMMPSKEIEKEERIKINDLSVIIQAGPNGWTILYTDGSSEYQDFVDTTDNNFKTAISVLEKHFDKSEILEDTESDEDTIYLCDDDDDDENDEP
jgi:hypothetical protein